MNLYIYSFYLAENGQELWKFGFDIQKERQKMKLFHASIEGAQHGAKGLSGFLEFANKAGAAGCQPTNFMLEDGSGGFLPAAVIKQKFEEVGLSLDGVSAHCPFWVLLTAWTQSKTIRPFIPAEVAGMPADRIEMWAEDYIVRLLNLCAELGVKVVPMFWGTAYGWEVATGYPWGFWKSAGYDLIAEGDERFVLKTTMVRNQAAKLGIKLAHEIHPGTAAMCAEDFWHLVDICDMDECLAVNDDPSHCWEGESAESRLLAVGKRVYGAHVKNHVVRPGLPLRSMQPNWPDRAMQFTDLPTGNINLQRHVETLAKVGYHKRYCEVMGTKTAPLVCEAESAIRDLDETAENGIQFIAENLCISSAGGSFEDGMGADKKE